MCMAGSSTVKVGVALALINSTVSNASTYVAKGSRL